MWEIDLPFRSRSQTKRAMPRCSRNKEAMYSLTLYSVMANQCCGYLWRQCCSSQPHAMGKRGGRKHARISSCSYWNSTRNSKHVQHRFVHREIGRNRSPVPEMYLWTQPKHIETTLNFLPPTRLLSAPRKVWQQHPQKRAHAARVAHGLDPLWGSSTHRAGKDLVEVLNVNMAVS